VALARGSYARLGEDPPASQDPPRTAIGQGEGHWSRFVEWSTKRGTRDGPEHRPATHDRDHGGAGCRQFRRDGGGRCGGARRIKPELTYHGIVVDRLVIVVIVVFVSDRFAVRVERR
jgi:hypothetical protein